MDREEAKNMINSMFDSFRHTAGYKDKVMMDIMLHRKEYEDSLNKMWAAVPSVGMKQMAEYKKAVDYLKSYGLKVLRNSQGNHKIVHKD